MLSTKFRIHALPRQRYEALLALSDFELAQHHARWVIADAEPGYPCRVSLEDAKQGERVLAISHLHQDSESPYRATGPIFVREHCDTANLEVGEIPYMLRHRLLSLRGYDEGGSMCAAEVVDGSKLEGSIAQLFQVEPVAYLHIHNAKAGCFNCAVQRAI